MNQAAGAGIVFGQTHPADGENNNINLLFQSVLLYFQYVFKPPITECPEGWS